MFLLLWHKAASPEREHSHYLWWHFHREINTTNNIYITNCTDNTVHCHVKEISQGSRYSLSCVHHPTSVRVSLYTVHHFHFQTWNQLDAYPLPTKPTVFVDAGEMGLSVWSSLYPSLRDVWTLPHLLLSLSLSLLIPPCLLDTHMHRCTLTLLFE